MPLSMSMGLHSAAFGRLESFRPLYVKKGYFDETPSLSVTTENDQNKLDLYLGVFTRTIAVS